MEPWYLPVPEPEPEEEEFEEVEVEPELPPAYQDEDEDENEKQSVSSVSTIIDGLDLPQPRTWKTYHRFSYLAMGLLYMAIFLTWSMFDFLVDRKWQETMFKPLDPHMFGIGGYGPSIQDRYLDIKPEDADEYIKITPAIGEAWGKFEAQDVLKQYSNAIKKKANKAGGVVGLRKHAQAAVVRAEAYPDPHAVAKGTHVKPAFTPAVPEGSDAHIPHGGTAAHVAAPKHAAQPSPHGATPGGAAQVHVAAPMQAAHQPPPHGATPGGGTAQVHVAAPKHVVHPASHVATDDFARLSSREPPRFDEEEQDSASDS